jgi:hypothetical protein
MRVTATALAVLAAGLLAACGNDKAEPDPSLLKPSERTKVVRAPSAGLRVVLPANLTRQELKSPGLFFASLGRTVVSAYAYRRGEQLPRNKKELEQARKRLVTSTKKRDKSYKLISSEATRAGKAPAVVLLGDQTISGERVRIRSIHVYRGTIEYVIEVFSPVAQFKANDAAISPNILKALVVSGKFQRRGGKDEEEPAAAKTVTETVPETTTQPQTATQPQTTTQP